MYCCLFRLRYKTLYMVQTEFFGKKSRTFQGLKSFFQRLLSPNNMKKRPLKCTEGGSTIAIPFFIKAKVPNTLQMMENISFLTKVIFIQGGSKNIH